MPDESLKCSRVAHPWYETKFTPKFTGITLHVTLIADKEGLRHKYDVFRAEIKGDMEEMINKRGFGGSEKHTNKVLEVIVDFHIRM